MIGQDCVCGICGNAATGWFRNIKPIDDGNWDIGEVQWRCDEHEKVGFIDYLTTEQRHLQYMCECIANSRMGDMETVK